MRHLDYIFSILISILAVKTTVLEASSQYRLTARKTHIKSSPKSKFFRSHDRTLLNYNIILPHKNSNQEKFPAVILVNPMGVPSQIYLATPAIELLVSRGIAVVLFNSRGHYLSQGVASAASKEERKDVSSLIDHLVSEYPIMEDKLAIGGVSQGASLSLFAASEEPRIKAVVAGSPWTEILKTAFYENNTVNESWAFFLPIPFSKTGGAIARKLRKALLSNPFDPFIQNFGKDRSIYPVIEKLNRLDTPVFLVANLDETLFQAKETIKLFEALETPKKLEIGRGDHAAIEILKPILSARAGIVNTPCKDNEKIWFKLAAWYLYWLKGLESNIIQEHKIHTPVKFSDKCERDSFDSFDFNEIENRFYFSANGKFVTSLEDIENSNNTIKVSSTPETFIRKIKTLYLML